MHEVGPVVKFLFDLYSRPYIVEAQKPRTEPWENDKKARPDLCKKLLQQTIFSREFLNNPTETILQGLVYELMMDEKAKDIFVFIKNNNEAWLKYFLWTCYQEDFKGKKS